MDLRAQPAQLFSVGGGELLQHRFTPGGQAQGNAPAIGGIPSSLDIASLGQAVEQAHSAMVFDPEALRQFTHGDALTPGKPLERQQCLVLLRCEAGSTGRSFAETEELTQGGAKGRQQFVVGLRDGHSYLKMRLFQSQPVEGAKHNHRTKSSCKCIVLRYIWRL